MNIFISRRLICKFFHSGLYLDDLYFYSIFSSLTIQIKENERKKVNVMTIIYHSAIRRDPFTNLLTICAYLVSSDVASHIYNILMKVQETSQCANKLIYCLTFRYDSSFFSGKIFNLCTLADKNALV